MEMLEAITGVLGIGVETKNKYKIMNSLGQVDCVLINSDEWYFLTHFIFKNVYKAKEDTDCCTRNMCGPARPFDMIIKV